MTEVWYALSVKQPWATLLAAGLKTIEVRTWPTTRRGRVLIHASTTPDRRPEGWARLTTPTLKAAAERRGGVIGSGELVDCVGYPTRADFAADRDRHLNEPDWFVAGGLHGFVLRELQFVPFFPCRGQTFFFRVRDPLAAGPRRSPPREPG